jgi:hypothetical protein
MTSQVINLEEKALERGSVSFCTCPVCEQESAFIPIVLKNKTGIFISAIVCVGPECQGEGIFIPVQNGYLLEPEDWEEGDDLPGG